MNIDLTNLDRVHPVVLREIGGALTRIAAALGPAEVKVIKGASVGKAEALFELAGGRLPEAYIAESIASLPTKAELAEAVKEATAEQEPTLYILPTKEAAEARSADFAAEVIVHKGASTGKADQPIILETPEQIDKQLGEASVVGEIAKDMLADSEALRVLTAGVIVLDAAGSLDGAPMMPAVEYEKPPGTFEDFQKEEEELAGACPRDFDTDGPGISDQLPPNELDTETGTVITGTGFNPTPELDAAGLPWDERIHAGTRTHIKGGFWKFKPRTTPELKDSVTAELRLTYPPIVAEPIQTDPATGHVVKSAEEVFGDAAPAAQDVQTAAAPIEYTFVSLLEEICTAVAADQVPQGTCDIVIADRCKKFGLTGMPDLQARPELVMQFRDELNDILGARF